MRSHTMHRNIRRSALRACACLLAFLLAGMPPCALASTSDVIAAQSLTLAIVADENMVLSPLSLRQRDPLSVLALCYEGLIALDDAEHPEPALAESWEPPRGNGSKWVFHLRPNVTFHNGKPLTAHDVCATLDYIFALGGYDEDRKSALPEEERGVHGNLVAYISGWQALDDLTVEITAARRYYGLLNAMTFPVLPAEEVGQAAPSGTGPYRIAEYTPGERIWLTAWRGWWQVPPTTQNIMANIYPDTEKALAAFDAGRVDATMTRSLSATRYAGSMRSFSLNYRTRQVEMLLMHNADRNKILAEEKVRRAVMLAIDRSALVRQAYQNMATPVTTPIAPGTWVYDESANRDGYDPAAARALLEECGWKLNSEGVRVRASGSTVTELRLRLLTYEEPGNSVRRSAATSIQEMLEQVGIITSLQVSPYESVKSRLSSGDFELVLCGMNLDVVPDQGFLLMSGINYCRYRSEAMTKLIQNWRKQVDEQDYRNALSEIQHLFATEVPFGCLYYRTGALLTRQTFTDVRDIRELELLRGIEAW